MERSRQAYRIDPENSNALNQLGTCLTHLGEYEKAERKFRDAHEAATSLEDKAASLGNLAGTLQDQGKYDQAEKLYRESLEIMKKEYQPGHPYIARATNNLSVLLKAKGKHDEAKKLNR